MAEKRAWLTNPTTGEKLHAWSHVKSIFYNKATNILLKDKLDEMDKLIDEKIKKAMMSNVQINDQNKVPTSALAFAMNQAITQNKNAITQLNSEAVKAVANSAGKEIGLWIGKLSDTQNYLQFRVDGTDKGYLVFDVSRNIE